MFKLINYTFSPQTHFDMKILKTIGSAFLVLIALLLAAGLFLSDNYGLERSLVINAPADKIFPQVNNLQNWNNWSPWKEEDPNMKITYSSETPEGAGAWYSWTSENPNVGVGRLEIVEIKENEYIKTKLIFDGNEEAPGNGEWKFEQVAEGTKVTWSMNGTASNYFERYFSILMDVMVGGTFEKGLSNIKNVTEKS